MSLLRFVKLSEDEIKQACDAFVNQIVQVSKPSAIILFGSMASCEASIESDIDLLAIYPDLATAKAAQRQVLQEKSPYPLAADLIFIDYETWLNQNRYSPLIEHIRSEGKLVYKSATFRDERLI